MKPRLRANGNLDYEGFTKVVGAFLDAAWGNKWGEFHEAFPNGNDSKDLTFPVITHSLEEKRLAGIGKDGVRELRPRHRESELIQNKQTDEEYYVETFGQMFEYDIIFEVWEENNTKANAAAKRFDEFMMVYMGAFKEHGVSHIHFENMKNSTESFMWREDIVVRRFHYVVRMEYLLQVPTSILEKVTGEVRLAALSDSSIDQSSSVNFKSKKEE